MDQEIKWDDMTSILSKIENINIKVYAPPKYLYDTLEFDPIKIKDAIQMGIECTPINFKDIEF